MPTYPPEHHLLRDLRISSQWLDEDELRVAAPLVDEIREPSGAMAVGPIVAIADLAACQTAMSAGEGDWIGTRHISFHSTGDVIEGPLVLSCQVLRGGRQLVTVRCELFDGEGSEEPTRLCGTTNATLVRLQRDETRTSALLDREIGRRDETGRATSGFTADVHDTMGLVEISPGVVELSMSGYVENSFGTVNGGASAIMAAAGTRSAVGEGWVVRDLEVHYVGRARGGPVRTMTEVLRIENDHAVVDVLLLDMSNERSPIVAATATLTALES